MALSVVYSRAQLGVEAPLVMVEIHLALGLPGFSIVGLPEKAVKESKDRVKSSLLNSNFEFPISKIIVNLAPADLPKEGGRYDLPIAVGILACKEQIPAEELSKYEFLGELALNGELRPISGVLPAAMAAKKAQRKLIIPTQNADEATLVSGLEVLPVEHILDVCAHFLKHKLITPHTIAHNAKQEIYEKDLLEVRGQAAARRALEIAAAGSHSLLFIGPPGTGKTMLASRMPTILPKMSDDEAIQAAAILSISQQHFRFQNWRKRPFRSPHHSASSVALVGGGNPPRPGEISLSHHGVLFLDELPEFSRHVLEALREPIESGYVTISRAARQCEFPASFQLLAAMNPCPCGYLGDKDHNCNCTSEQVQRYRLKISGPILDRIDMHIEVLRPEFQQLSLNAESTEESSALVRKRVEAARDIQLTRAQKPNAKLSAQELKKFIHLQPKEEKLIENAITKLKLSARSYHRILKVALTIADLENAPTITTQHLSEAISYRKLK